MKNTKQDGLYTAAYLVPIIAAVIIAVLNILYFLGFLSSSATDNSNDIAFANVISIFGIAVSVWVGLSIASSIDRAKINHIEHSVGVLEDAQTLYKEARRRAIIDMMYTEEHNPLGIWIAHKIEGIEVEVLSDDVYDLLLAEERYYSCITRKIYENEEDLISQHDACITAINKLLKKTDVEETSVLKTILECRIALVSFATGYRVLKEKRIADFQKTIDTFSKCSKDILGKNFSIEQVDSITDDGTTSDKEIYAALKKTCDNESMDIMAYILNIIGESYSKIAESCDIKCPLAVKLCHFAVVIAEQRECPKGVYYRNYGCAIERLADRSNKSSYIAALKKAIAQYQKALKYENTRDKALHCITSAYNKEFETLIEWAQNDSVPITQAPDLKLNFTRLRHVLNNYEKYQELYQKAYPNMKDSYLMSALYYRDRYMISDPKGKHNAALAMRSAMNCFSLLSSNDFSSRIDIDYCGIIEETHIK